MTMTDPLSDMLTRIRNGAQAKKTEVPVPYSNFKFHVVEILKKHGFIRNFSVDDDKTELHVELKYTHEGEPVIRGMRRVSRPGRRRYSGASGLHPVKSGIGMAVISTSRGIMTDAEARKANVGGEILFHIY